MDRFKLDNEKMESIAKDFNVTVETVKRMKSIYSDVYVRIKHQYLAHMIRTIEEAVRESLNNPLFQIKCVPVADDSKIKEFGSAQYYENMLYIIYFHPQMEEKQLRICIAHELGHLFVETIVKQKAPETKDTSEPLSSIFGILTILDKNDFYKTKTSCFQHSTWQDIVKDFSLLKNSNNNKHNIS